MQLDRELRRYLVDEAARAPSAHNAQPARWRLEADGAVTLFEDLDTRLIVGDPEGWDARLSLGTAFEGLAIAAAEADLGLSAPRPVPAEGREVAGRRNLARIAEATLSKGAATDPLAHWVPHRRTYRGRFRRAEAGEVARLRSAIDAAPDLTGIFDTQTIAEIGRLHDHCTWEFLRQPDYHAELHRWMRYSSKDPAWNRDGLSVDCLGISPIEQRFVRLLLSPRGFRWVKRLGLGPAVAAERSQVRSATALVLLHGDAEANPLDHGRRLYRAWLELTAIGFLACPMSSVLECAPGVEYLAAHHPPGTRVIKLLRVGPLKDGERVAASRRLPTTDLLV
ncbi:MAG: hypothetical protein AAF481_04370 [Acidobacteriota bacterium]